MEAQGTTYEGALTELREGRKVGHWVWWVFPQLTGLGSSERSDYYGLADAQEARDYLSHPVLGPRLVESVSAVLSHSDRGPVAVMGPDAVKLRSCLTLFKHACPEEPLFSHAITTLFSGHEDHLTLERVRPASP